MWMCLANNVHIVFWCRDQVIVIPLYRAQQQCSPASDILINYFNLLLSTTFTSQSRWRISPAVCCNCVFCTSIFIICIILHIMCLPGLLLLCPRLCRWYYSVSRLMYDRAWRDPGLGHCSDDKLVTYNGSGHHSIQSYKHNNDGVQLSTSALTSGCHW